MPSYSIVFLDVDGTLLDSAHRVSPATRTLLRKLHDRGVPVVLASARPPKGLEPIYDQLEFRGPAICCAGALAVLPDQHILYDHGIPASTAARFEQTVLDGWPRLALSAYLYDAWLTPNPDDPAIRREADITGCQPLASALGSEAQRLGDVHKLLCIGPERDITDLQHQLTPRFPELTVLRSNPTYLEVVANGVCKEQTAAVLLDPLWPARRPGGGLRGRRGGRRHAADGRAGRRHGQRRPQGAGRRRLCHRHQRGGRRLCGAEPAAVHPAGSTISFLLPGSVPRGRAWFFCMPQKKAPTVSGLLMSVVSGAVFSVLCPFTPYRLSFSAGFPWGLCPASALSRKAASVSAARRWAVTPG